MIPINVLIAPLDNVLFHYNESVFKWKLMYHWRMASERKLSKEQLKCEEIVELILDVYIMKTIPNLRFYYPKLLKEFIVNIPKNFNKVGRK